jgi:peptidyl-tRNA hydrolase, PTH1 family
MNKVSLDVYGGGKAKPEPDRPKQQSHIRQARQQAPAVKIPETGPMAAMLKRLFGGRE